MEGLNVPTNQIAIFVIVMYFLLCEIYKISSKKAILKVWQHLKNDYVVAWLFCKITFLKINLALWKLAKLFLQVNNFEEYKNIFFNRVFVLILTKLTGPKIKFQNQNIVCTTLKSWWNTVNQTWHPLLNQNRLMMKMVLLFDCPLSPYPSSFYVCHFTWQDKWQSVPQ